MNINALKMQNAQNLIYQYMSPTPQYSWPLLNEKLGHEIWVKHENHAPTGAFKVRGGIIYLHELAKSKSPPKRLVTATRGNHGQSIAFSARNYGFETNIFVPINNCLDKNQAMCGFGAKLHIEGDDFDCAKLHAAKFANENDAHFVKSFDENLVLGVSTYAIELMNSVANIDKIYVPIGGGSGICGLIMARDLLGLKTQIIGVVSDNADAYKQSFECGKIIETQSANTFADGMAVKAPFEPAFEIIKNGAEYIISVSDKEIAGAIDILYQTTKNIAEGAGAAALAASMKEKNKNKNKKIAIILSGGNINKTTFIQAISGCCPRA